MDWAYLFNSFDGRIGRQTFWTAMVALLVAEIFAHIIAEAIQGDRLSAIVDLAFTYPEFALSVKRANDRNIPTIVLGIFFVGSAALDFVHLIGLDTTPEHQNPFVLAALLAWAALALVLAIELFFRRGTIGPNRFGPDPLAPGP